MNDESRFHRVEPLRDLESNWGVDLAKNLEDYLLKICSGEITTTCSVNFAEAALLVQGSIQVYSRKVEYLYNLVLHTLDFLSHKSLQESTSAQPEESSSRQPAQDEDNDFFWGCDDIQAEAKTLLDNDKLSSLTHFVKPPPNLVVLEGDCLDTTGETGELDSYLLATNDLYRDFILLDPCDAVAVDDFLKENIHGKSHASAYRGSCFGFGSKSRKSFFSPRPSGGTNNKSAIRMNPDVNLNGSPLITRNLEFNDINMDHDCPPFEKPGNANPEFDMDDGFSDPMDPYISDVSDDEENNPWKPLNPHEPGNLKTKPFKKVKAFKGLSLNASKRVSATAQFPPAKMHGTVSPELMELWEKQQQHYERLRGSQSPPLYAKLRDSLINGGHDHSFHPETENEDDGYDSDSPIHDDDGPNMMDEDAPIFDDKQNNDNGGFDNNGASEHEEPLSQPNLEDLCRSHLDALLASMSEAEKQTEIAARVSSWKQRIEHNLEEQESRPPFDIHYYGDRILDSLSVKAHDESVTSFGDVVAGQEKHDIARSFSALLQLVNNGDVDLEGDKGDSTCYTGVNPFHVRLLKHNKRHEDVQIWPSKKRLNSPTKRGPAKCHAGKAQQEKFVDSDSTRSSNTNKSTPEGKRRRR